MTLKHPSRRKPTATELMDDLLREIAHAEALVANDASIAATDTTAMPEQSAAEASAVPPDSGAQQRGWSWRSRRPNAAG